jgi:hypothetical protein
MRYFSFASSVHRPKVLAHFFIKSDMLGLPVKMKMARVATRATTAKWDTVASRSMDVGALLWAACGAVMSQKSVRF